jgi:hypothetical protein
MAKLIYVANVSLDGYIEDAHGSLEWTAPIDEVFTFITDLVRPVGTYLYGRRMYETMAVWETQPALAAHAPVRGAGQRIGPQRCSATTFRSPPRSTGAGVDSRGDRLPGGVDRRQPVVRSCGL